jgi:hypothetical protein
MHAHGRVAERVELTDARFTHAQGFCGSGRRQHEPTSQNKVCQTYPCASKIKNPGVETNFRRPIMS